jgi:hypothetical protein
LPGLNALLDIPSRAVMSLFVLGGTISLAACPQSPAKKITTRGEALFAGRESLKGTIRGHEGRLPPEVVVCGNCHPAANQSRADAAAPRIDRSWLLEASPRRRGPPTSYDSRSFCRLLRTGVDPAYILIAREMPVYDVDDAQCGELWRFLTEEGRANGNQ